MRRAATCLLVVAAGCAPLRFADRGVLWVERDDRPSAKPAEAPLATHWYALRDSALLPLDRALGLEYGGEAVNVNALDEVPDSSWYRDPRRAGVPRERLGLRPRPLTDEEMAWGAARPDDVPVQPLTVVKGKAIGAAPGFVAVDARGVRYMIKLDPPDRPGFATAVEVVVSRLAWACGFQVPAEVMFDLDLARLRVAPGATGKDRRGGTVPFTDGDLRLLLGDHRPRPDGTVLALASRWLPGAGVGPFQYFGRRGDDANDRWPHEDRRDLRGFGTFSAWVNNVETVENNTLDMYVGPPGRGHVVHYQQDVGGAFGTWAFKPAQYWMGHESYVDLGHIAWALLTLGFGTGYWEEARYRERHDRAVAASPTVGDFRGDDFDPRTWRPLFPNPAFDRRTARDRYWAAKRILLLDGRELRAAVSAGRYPPEVADRVVGALLARRARVLRADLAASAPLDWFRLDGDSLCFDDLWLGAGLGASAAYQAREGARPLAVSSSCVALGRESGYRVVELRVRHDGGSWRPPVRIHLIRRSGEQRILGIER